ncbi:MAG: hypothetical protein JST30_16340 [Armatimonadetes bacterium]|nr:hypothetical protein [Armatimonadota bacterium]
MVRERDWGALEAVARQGPNQQLCDTVNELANGLDDKSDVRKAKRILYFLREAGFTPSRPDSFDSGFPDPTPLRYGLIGTTDEQGFSEVGVCFVEKGKLYWVMADVHYAASCVILRDHVLPRERAGDVRFQMLHKPQSARYLVEAPYEYCLSKLAFVHRHLPHNPGNRLSDEWAERLSDVPIGPYHLLQDVDVSPAKDDECAVTLASDRFSDAWRLFLHARIHPRLCKALSIVAAKNLKGEERSSARLEAIWSHEDEWTVPRLRHDSVWRCLDMAWAMHRLDRPAQRDAFCRLATRIANGSSPRPFYEVLAKTTAGGHDDRFEEMILDTKHNLFSSCQAA